MTKEGKVLHFLEQIWGTHILVFSGDGYGRSAEQLFSTANEAEARQLCEVVRKLLEEREAGKILDSTIWK